MLNGVRIARAGRLVARCCSRDLQTKGVAPLEGSGGKS